MTIPLPTAENVVAEWRDTMEGVPEGEIERAFIVDGHGEAIDDEAVLYLPEDNEAEFRGAHAEVLSAWFERCSPSGISGLLALIEQQAAELAAVRRQLRREEDAHVQTIEERDGAERWADKLARAIGGDEIGEHSNLNSPWANALGIAEAAEARVTALEAEKAGLVAIEEIATTALNRIASQQTENAVDTSFAAMVQVREIRSTQR